MDRDKTIVLTIGAFLLIIGLTADRWLSGALAQATTLASLVASSVAFGMFIYLEIETVTRDRRPGIVGRDRSS